MIQENSDLAKNFKFDGDKRPVAIERLDEIFSQFKKDDWLEYLAHENVIRVSYNEIAKLTEAEIYCIPSSKNNFGQAFSENRKVMPSDESAIDAFLYFINNFLYTHRTMESYFTISQSSPAKERPPISYKVRNYFEDFITEHVLKSKKIIYGGHWKIRLAIFFVDEFPKLPEQKVFLSKSVRTISAEHIKLYEILISVKPLQDSALPLLTTIELMYAAISLFFTTIYKKISPEFMTDLWKQVDLEYLLALPYPASFQEQQYLLDEQMYLAESNGEVRLTTVEEQAERGGYKGKLKN